MLWATARYERTLPVTARENLHRCYISACAHEKAALEGLSSVPSMARKVEPFAETSERCSDCVRSACCSLHDSEPEIPLLTPSCSTIRNVQRTRATSEGRLRLRSRSKVNCLRQLWRHCGRMELAPELMVRHATHSTSTSWLCG